MTGEPDTSLVLPASIPFEELKGRDLEECVYWLLEAMGARDLEWRSGGSGGGAADQGRDLEATFYASSADGEMESQRWWITIHNTRDLLEVVGRVACSRKKQAVDRQWNDRADMNGGRRRKSDVVGRNRKGGTKRRKR
jgi:hypothetical protein